MPFRPMSCNLVLIELGSEQLPVSSSIVPKSREYLCNGKTDA